MKQTTIVIENESYLPMVLTSFLEQEKERIEPIIHLNMRHAPFSSVKDELSFVDAIMVKSEFLYKKQLEDFVHGLTLLPPNRTYYLWETVKYMNLWVSKIDGVPVYEQYFRDLPRFVEKLIQLVRINYVLDIPLSNKVEDIQRVYWDDTKQFFYGVSYKL